MHANPTYPQSNPLIFVVECRLVPRPSHDKVRAPAVAVGKAERRVLQDILVAWNATYFAQTFHGRYMYIWIDVNLYIKSTCKCRHVQISIHRMRPTFHNFSTKVFYIWIIYISLLKYLYAHVNIYKWNALDCHKKGLYLY